MGDVAELDGGFGGQEMMSCCVGVDWCEVEVEARLRVFFGFSLHLGYRRRDSSQVVGIPHSLENFVANFVCALAVLVKR